MTVCYKNFLVFSCDAMLPATVVNSSSDTDAKSKSNAPLHHYSHKQGGGCDDV